MLLSDRVVVLKEVREWGEGPYPWAAEAKSC